MYVLGAIVLISLLVTGVVALLNPSPVRLAVAATLAVTWLLVNQDWEGPVLWVPLAGHGLTVSDLLTPLVLLLLIFRRVDRRRRVQTDR